MTITIHDARPCTLGESAFWHPLRKSFYWLDILDRRLLTRFDDSLQEWELPEMISAIGWIDHDTLLLAGESRFWIYDLQHNVAEPHIELEAHCPQNRSNDGRADPAGGFWIGTMEREGRSGEGHISRYYRGEVTVLFDGLSIPNAICFSPDHRYAYFTDTPSRVIQRVQIDADGWPVATVEEHIRLAEHAGMPDGALVDADGNLWVALWGGGRVAGFDPAGSPIGEWHFPARQTTCPALGGADLNDMFVTSAAVGLDARTPSDGATFQCAFPRHGQREHQVLLGNSARCSELHLSRFLDHFR